MMKQLGTVGSYVSFGWQQAKARIGQHRWPLVMIAIVVIVLSLLQNTFGTYETGMVDPFTGMPETALNTIGIVLEVVSGVFGLVYGIGMIKLGLAGATDEEYSFVDMFRHRWVVIWKYLAVAIVFGLLLFVPLAVVWWLIYLASTVGSTVGMVVGVILWLVGVVYFFHMIFRVSFVLYYVVVDHAKTMSPVEMIKHSYRLSQGNVWKLFATGFVAWITNILGVLALGVGLLWTIPLAQIAIAKLYKDIDDAYHEDDEDGAIEEMALDDLS